MLVGVGGSGKQSLTKLATSIVTAKLKTIKITKNYGMKDFREDLQSVYLMAGKDGFPTTFLMNDNQIIQEDFLENINNILNTGEIAKLFDDESV